MVQVDFTIVEQDQELITRIGAELRRSGFDPVLHCADSLASYDNAQRAGTSLVIARYRLPDIHAEQILETARVPVIVIGEHVGEREIARCIRRGAVDFLALDALDQLGPAVVEALQPKKQIPVSSVETSDPQWRKVMSIFREVSDAVIIVDANDAIQVWSHGAERIYGWSVRDALGKVFSTLVRSASSPFGDGRGAGASGSTQPHDNWTKEILHTRKDGSSFRVYVTGSALLDDHKRRLGSAYIVHDLSDQKPVESAPSKPEDSANEQQLVEALRETANAFASALDRPELMKRLLATIARIIPHDSASILMIEGDQAVVVATYHNNPSIADADAASSFSLQLPNIHHMLTTGQPFVIPDTASYPEWVMLRAWIRGHVGAPIRSHGRVTGFVLVYSATPDVYTAEHADRLQVFADQLALALENADLYDEIRRYAAELEQRVAARTAELEVANERLTELDRLKSKFIADMSHELRTPITSLNMGLFLLERDGPERMDRHLANMKTEMERLMNLTTSVLDLGRLDLIGDNTAFSATDLNLLIWQVMRVHRIHAEANSLQLIFDPDPELPTISGDQNQLQQVVSNLLVNAVTYTLSGEVYISTELDRGARGVWLSIRDTGIGIEADDMPHVFERFYRGRQIGQTNLPGTGIGLSIVKEIVTAHHGKIDIESAPGRGTLVRVWLPITYTGQEAEKHEG